MSGVVTIRDVPDEVRAALAGQAREAGQSLQAFLLRVLTRQAAFARNGQLVGEVEGDLAGGGGAGQEAPDPAELLGLARNERSGPGGSARPATGGAG